MTNRELFHATLAHENGDELLHFEQGFNVPYKKWYNEGLPADVVPVNRSCITKDVNFFDHFNVSGWLFCPFEQFCVPAFDPKTIGVKEGRRISINSNGNTLMWIDEAVYNRDDGTHVGSPPFEIDFAIKNIDDYRNNRYRYIGNTGLRFGDDWLAANAADFSGQSDHIPSVWVHGPFAFLREMLGTETAMAVPYEDPEMTKLILRDHLDTCMLAAEKVIKECKPDCSYVWEDCCGSTGPFISPSIFDEAFSWWYKEWKDYLTSMGVRWSVLDTDGDPSPLVKQWYESGIDCMLPWEVNGVDMLKFADEYPDYVMMGGIYKHIFEPGDISQIGRFKSDDVFQAIDDELERVVKPMRKRGGYIASLDHAANQSVSYPGYKYYSDQLAAKYGKANIVTRFG
ncbi:MAG: uroporphyrinogen decarboxylase/cobalamine-independent methonine synthase family protein [Saccharofermentanales bacterium]